MPSYSYILRTNVGKVRRDIGDTDIPDNAHFSDEELQSFFDEGGSVKAGAGLALLAWAAELARGDEMVDAGSWRGDTRDVAEKMRKLAKEYFDLSGYKPAGRRPVLLSAPVDWTPQVAGEREYQEDVYDTV